MRHFTRYNNQLYYYSTEPHDRGGQRRFEITTTTDPDPYLFDLYGAVTGAADVVAGSQRVLDTQQRWPVSVVHLLETDRV